MEVLNEGEGKEDPSALSTSVDEQSMTNDKSEIGGAESNAPCNKLDFGGPMSAFSSLYNLETSGGEKPSNHISDIRDCENARNSALQTNIFRSVAGIFQDVPVAPAFAQICKYMRHESV